MSVLRPVPVWQTLRCYIPLSLLLTAACGQSSAPPATDGAKLVQATLQLLTSDHSPICIDNRTTGRPLAIYAAMRVAPPLSRIPLAWHVPAPLRPPVELSGKQLYRDSIGLETAHLREPNANAAVLPEMMQRRLDGDASRLAWSGMEESLTISPRWARGVTARWWLFNRFTRECAPTYTLSNPTWQGNSGYITVMTEHWGTTYAFHRAVDGWKPVGQWTSWLY